MIREAGCNEVDGRRVSLQLGIWTMGRLRVRGILLDTYLGGGRVGTREIIPGESDMKFVKNFTHPDFQATSFTPQKCVICEFFLAN